MKDGAFLSLNLHIDSKQEPRRTRGAVHCFLARLNRSAANMVLCLFLLGLTTPDATSGEAKQLFRIGTGGLLGVYHPIGKIIADGLTPSMGPENENLADFAGLEGYIGVAQSSGGSVANVRALAAGEIEAGLVQADVAS